MTNTSKGLLLTASGAFIISFEALFIKFTSIQPLAVSFYIGLLLFLTTSSFLVTKKEIVLQEIKKSSFLIALFGAILMAVSNLLFISAIKYTLTANVVLIIATSPLISSFFAWIIYKKRVEKNIYVASAFIFLGLYIIFSNQLGLGNLIGNIYAFSCAILFSLSFVFLSQHPDINRFLLLSISGVFLCFLTLFFVKSLKIDLNSLIYILIMGILITPISRVLITNGTKYISASEVSLLLIIETIMAPIWVWIFLNEVPSKTTLWGGILIITTLVLNSLYVMKKTKN